MKLIKLYQDKLQEKSIAEKEYNEFNKTQKIISDFDKLLIDGLINFEYAILKINQLYQINERLPMIAKIERLHSWTQSEHIT